MGKWALVIARSVSSELAVRFNMPVARYHHVVVQTSLLISHSNEEWQLAMAVPEESPVLSEQDISQFACLAST